MLHEKFSHTTAGYATYIYIFIASFFFDYHLYFAFCKTIVIDVQL